MRLLKLLTAIICMSWIATATAVSAPLVSFQEGKDYLVISPIGKPQLHANVVEFFNYGCPACYHLEPELQVWLTTKPKNITFARLPVVFHPDWDVYSKAFYVAQALGIEKKMTPLLFNAIHKQREDLGNEKALAAFFVKNGVPLIDFENLYNFTPGIYGELNRADEMMRTYLIDPVLMQQYNWIPQIPAFIINGKYLTSISLVNGDAKKLFQIIDYLVKK